MKVSSRFRYGLRLLVDLAEHYGKGPLLLKEIAKCEKISKKYLEQIVISLRTAGLIGATRGSKGGYYLIKAPNKVKVIDIYKILEGPFAPVECLDNPLVCNMTRNCPTRRIWADIGKAVENTLDKMTLAHLVK
jgi:Rrf2 family cysteine metabolism transcriptional repressor